MCVTANPAHITDTRTFVYATHQDDDRQQPVHVCGYQNEANMYPGSGPNCMFLNFAGQNLALVRGPEHTRTFMEDMTRSLSELIYVESFRGGYLGGTRRGITVEDYGDYTVILSQGSGDILSALEEVPVERRPFLTQRLTDMVNFYMSFYPEDSFVLACFNGKVKPKHPITVQYEPRNPDVLTIPGLDGHDGLLPVVGAPVYRNFRVAFAVSGEELPYKIRYQDPVAGKLWAPTSVTGFVDNRPDGRNGDYVLPIEAATSGLTGWSLVESLI